jgi:hypothetical protein
MKQLDRSDADRLLELRESYTRHLERATASLDQELCAKEQLIADTKAAGNNADALRKAVSVFIQRSSRMHQTSLAMQRADKAELEHDLRVFAHD